VSAKPAPDAVEMALDMAAGLAMLHQDADGMAVEKAIAAARAACAALLARAEAQRVALEAADVMAKDYEEWHMVGGGTIAPGTVRAYRAARTKAGA
jgi:hypothetical protein